MQAGALVGFLRRVRPGSLGLWQGSLGPSLRTLWRPLYRGQLQSLRLFDCGTVFRVGFVVVWAAAAPRLPRSRVLPGRVRGGAPRPGVVPAVPGAPAGGPRGPLALVREGGRGADQSSAPRVAPNQADPSAGGLPPQYGDLPCLRRGPRCRQVLCWGARSAPAGQWRRRGGPPRVRRLGNAPRNAQEARHRPGQPGTLRGGRAVPRPRPGRPPGRSGGGGGPDNAPAAVPHFSRKAFAAGRTCL
jgi:hypothetical protein